MALNLIASKSGDFNSVSPRQVVLGTTGSITDGMLVLATLGTRYATPSAQGTSTFAVGTNFFYGVAKGTSSETLTADGIANVFNFSTNEVYYIPVDSTLASTVDTQPEYNTMVGKRINYKVTGNLVTCLLTDAATNPFIVEPMDVSARPGMIAVSVRAGALYNA